MRTKESQSQTPHSHKSRRRPGNESVYIDGTKRGTATDINNLRGYGDVLTATVDAGTHTANLTTNVSGTIAADGTISGIRLNTTQKHINELPAGLYISDGKKFIIKK